MNKNQRVAILGPVTTNTYYGGVANFDEELLKGFVRLGHECKIFTLQKNISVAEYDVESFKSVFGLYKSVKHYSPDIVIASLAYGGLFFFMNNIKKIYILHGFFERIHYGRIKAAIAPIYQKIIAMKSDEVIANSFFTKMINRDFFNIKCTRVIHLGVAEEYIKKIKEEKKDLIEGKEKRSILYAGRFVKSKRPINVLKALSILQDRGVKYKIYMAGDGPENKKLHYYAEEKSLNVIFLGVLPHNILYDYYKKSEIFISLNDSEPMGITFFEAYLMKCKIVSPFTGGQVESLINEPLETRTFVDPDDPFSIARGLLEMMNGESIFYDELSDLNYENVAKKILCQ